MRPLGAQNLPFHSGMKNDNGNKMPEARGKFSETVSWYTFCCLNRQTEAVGRLLPAARRARPEVKEDTA
jgi:hypothetical protein